MKSEDIKSRVVSGKNAVVEIIKSGKSIEALFVSDDRCNKSVLSVINLAKENGVPIKKVKLKTLDNLSKGIKHQGVVATLPCYKYAELEDIFKNAKIKNHPPFIIILDNIEDPHNLGAIIRTAECVNADGVIIPIRHSAGLTGVVERASAGAVEHVSVVRVTNISNTIDVLKKQGVWVFGAEAGEKLWCEEDLTCPTAIVIGSEGEGISRLVKEKCDGILSLPLMGKVNSLNASVAAGIFMYEVLRQRKAQIRK